ncbi:hypothetical protein ACLB2K_052455 [Fragaria x ananassa]
MMIVLIHLRSVICSRIGEVIDEDVLHARVPFVARTQQCFAVKAGIDGLLDIARRSFCDTSEGLSPLHRQGFYFSIPQKSIQGKLPSQFIQVLKHGNNIHCSTLELASLNVRNKSAAAECYIRTEVCLEELVDAIQEDVSALTLLAEALSGKSTSLLQVCLIVILAQIGCYVPAHFSTLRVVDRIFTRMGTVDSLESNSSTFMTEMKETAFIMQNVSQRSLVVMDELGRATSSSDGFAIAWSCCEHLLSLKAYTIFATHMENLSELVTVYPNVKILHFDVDIKNNRLDFKFQLKEGPRHVPHYGLLLAEVAGLPSLVTETARNITSRKRSKEDGSKLPSISSDPDGLPRCTASHMFEIFQPG